MPLLARASAVSLMSCALTSHPKWFQLFHPIGGVRARRLFCERGGWLATAGPLPRDLGGVDHREPGPLRFGATGRGRGAMVASLSTSPCVVPDTRIRHCSVP